MTPEKILRNLDRGFFMTHQEQAEAAALIRDQEKSIKALHENLHDYAAEIVRLRSKINGALALLQTGQSMHIPAAIEVLRGNT
tara:strand:- start:157 stop:405 length:249 start_codon:yes stop_codon:yes gene_type:complete